MKRRRNDMETTNPTEPSSSSPTAAADPRWVMLNCHSCGAPWDTGDRVIADEKTVAESCTSTGRHFRVSLGFAPPPAWSYLYHAMVDTSTPASNVEIDDEDVMVDTSASASAGESDDDTAFSGSSRSPPTRRPGSPKIFDYSKIVAAHGNSVLFQMTTDDGAFDYFVYTAGAGGSASPRLTLLPQSRFPYLLYRGRRRDDGDDIRALNLCDTGILRRGEDEFLVAQIEVPFGEPRDTAELCLLRVRGGGNGSDWELKKAVPIIVQDQEHAAGGGKVHMLRDLWRTVAVIPVGDRYLCWLNYLTGFLVWDTAVDKASPPKLRYVPLPAELVDDEEANEKYNRNNYDKKRCRNMCAAGADAVRLVSVDSRCCCGGRVAGSSACKGSRFAFTVTMWTLRLRTTEERMTWVQDRVLDCDELWALPEYGSLPRMPLEYPVVSSDDPDVVCFRIRNDYSHYLGDEHRKEWLLEIDTRRKRLRSVLPTTIPLWKKDSDNIQAKFRY